MNYSEEDFICMFEAYLSARTDDCLNMVVKALNDRGIESLQDSVTGRHYFGKMVDGVPVTTGDGLPYSDIQLEDDEKPECDNEEKAQEQLSALSSISKQKEIQQQQQEPVQDQPEPELLQQQPVKEQTQPL